MIKYSGKSELIVCEFSTLYKEIEWNYIENEKIIELNKYNFIKLYEHQLLNTPTCKLFNSNIIKENNIKFDKNISLGEDLLFNLEYFKYIDSIMIIDKKLYYYRRYGNSTLSSKFRENKKQIELFLIDEVTSYFQGNCDICILNRFRIMSIISILDNELYDISNGIFKRYRNIRNLLKNNEIKKKINMYKVGNNKFLIFLLSHNLYLSYKFWNKIRKFKVVK